ncbi:hypothetical protein, partial [Nonomuraea sp. MG754425]|uniref:hypothetical protein n=1 Tax=Nonomuraea sp. MG754425 TaxID=2570319 RepID=UPI001F23CC6C
MTRLEEALVLAREIGFRAGEAIALRHLGAHDLTSASRDLARHRLSTAIDLLSELGHDHELALACHHRSIAAEELGDLPAALADAERACALGHEAARDRAFRLAVRLNLGMTAWTHAEQAKLNALTAWLTPRPEASATEAPTPEASTPDDPSLPDPGQDLTDTARTLMTAARNTRDPEQAALLIHRARTTLDHLRRRPLDEPTPQGLPAPRSIRPPTRAELDALVSVPGHEGATGARALLGFHLDESTVTVLAHRT